MRSCVPAQYHHIHSISVSTVRRTHVRASLPDKRKSHQIQPSGPVRVWCLEGRGSRVEGRGSRDWDLEFGVEG
jgi:hypothetical protein